MILQLPDKHIHAPASITIPEPEYAESASSATPPSPIVKKAKKESDPVKTFNLLILNSFDSVMINFKEVNII